MSEGSGFQVGSDAPMYYERHIGRFMAPFVQALVAATVEPGSAVLDIACGTGFATRAAATAAGPGAHVEGVDVNPAMLGQARTTDVDSGAAIRWTEASAMELPYGDASFDAVICQQGLQFFPDPATGLHEMARVTRKGGRVGATVWAPPEQSPFLHHETSMLARHGGRNQVAFSTTEHQLSDWFSEGGIHDVSVELITVEVDLPAVSVFVPGALRALPWSTSFIQLADEQQAAALRELDAHLAEYRTDDGIRVPFSSYLATAVI